MGRQPWPIAQPRPHAVERGWQGTIRYSSRFRMSFLKIIKLSGPEFVSLAPGRDAVLRVLPVARRGERGLRDLPLRAARLAGLRRLSAARSRYF